MTYRMLIDASHPEETRVVVIDGTRLEEFDFESSTKERLKGNIYLAKITRVEPSLQAAFVDYGRERHGFLAFSEIHPDYYQIPIGDRKESQAPETNDVEDEEVAPIGAKIGDEDDSVEVVSGDEIDEINHRRSSPNRRYKIQEVIKRRQIMLVQVAKDERGTKGAALTTYLSLAGRYCVLMPNTSRGGGISRKIVDADDRRRLKTVLSGLPVTEDMGVILRTAGMNRTKSEIRRDFDYLVRQWETIRELTLNSTAPTLIYEEGNLIKRTIRDLYSKDIEQILIEGDAGYRVGKKFMRDMIPSHAKRVQQYDDNLPLFQRYQVIDQLDAMHSPVVQLKSGGSIVINPTEALVAIDVNSGRATKERNIEETATKTNVEAAAEIARQLRLRDLAGLIVIDFIDMEESKNLRLVERRFKEAIKNDRARIQVGRITAFGLLELSRQRLRPSLLEASSQRCPHCGGSGHVRSTASTALHVLRMIEEEGVRARTSELTVYAPNEVALYILNDKRQALREIEDRNRLQVHILSDDTLVPPDCRLERSKARGGANVETTQSEESAGPPADKEKAGRKRRRRRAKALESGVVSQDDRVNDAGVATAQPEATGTEASEETRKRRRRGKRGGRRRGRGTGTVSDAPPNTALPSTHESEAVNVAAPESQADTFAGDTSNDIAEIQPTSAETAEAEPAKPARRRCATPKRAPKEKKAVAKTPSRRKAATSEPTSVPPDQSENLGSATADSSPTEDTNETVGSETLDSTEDGSSQRKKATRTRRPRRAAVITKEERNSRTGGRRSKTKGAEPDDTTKAPEPSAAPVDTIDDASAQERQVPLTPVAETSPEDRQEPSVARAKRTPRRGWWQRHVE